MRPAWWRIEVVWRRLVHNQRFVTLALMSMAIASGAVAGETVTVDPPAPSLALARYLTRAANGDPWSAPNTVMLDIDARLPGLAERGHLRAIRYWAERQTPEYLVIHIEGDATVKQQVIARYLTAEKLAAATPISSIAITPANYKFHYVGSSGGPPVYVFRITPRKKRPGLIKGELWIEGTSGLAVHQAGYLVKRPSIFIKRLKIVRDVSLRDGAPFQRRTNVDIDVRLVGRAELMIVESPYTNQPSTINEPPTLAAQESGSHEYACSIGH